MLIQTSKTALQTPLPFQIDIQFSYDPLLKMVTVGLILLTTWIVSRMLSGFLSRILGKLSSQMARQAKRAVAWLVWLIGILVCLDQLGLELSILLMILVLGGIMLIVALRDILLNIASREAIAIHSPFKIGDWIQVDKYFGRVIDINWMSTVLVTLDSEVIHIPNSKIVKSTVINRTASGETRIHIPLTVDNTMDLLEVEKILMDIGNELKEELVPDSKPEVRVAGLNNHVTKLVLLLKITNPAKSRLIASEVRRRIKIKLDRSQGKL